MKYDLGTTLAATASVIAALGAVMGTVLTYISNKRNGLPNGHGTTNDGITTIIKGQHEMSIEVGKVSGKIELLEERVNELYKSRPVGRKVPQENHSNGEGRD